MSLGFINLISSDMAWLMTLAGGWKLFTPLLFGVTIEHDVVHVVTIVPNSKLGSHPVVQGFRWENLQIWRESEEKRALTSFCLSTNCVGISEAECRLVA